MKIKVRIRSQVSVFEHSAQFWNLPGERPMRERFDRVLFPLVLK